MNANIANLPHHMNLYPLRNKQLLDFQKKPKVPVMFDKLFSIVCIITFALFLFGYVI
jgi:hypothetical protein